MPTRRLWVLLLLAAIFSMHGAQYIAADAGLRHTEVAVAQHGAEDPLDAESLSASTAAGGELQQVTPSVDTGEMAGQPSPGHGVASHLWSLCLAILYAGLVLLAAASLIGMVAAPVLRDVASHLSSFRGWARLPRPPDLSALCLLRI
ncbi:hypothetical protein GCM10027451_50490 [Geodermatophilus aquaeductus]|uniref:Uncharacterized protein n=1 Tax=Geodermatophilus aquaeductus TaxID=1564161 RepID=A0A521FUK4_9ACTN|nr:DUF6153 family protein [Geodermatophilus aquaeductus]SMO99905.1 hypothetical protein SAMN06273567_12034 [Geodermatophilus aquaeductus]